MAAARLCMRQVKSVFRLRLLENKSHSAIGRALGIGKTTVAEYLQRLNKSKLKTWEEIERLSDEEIERELGFSKSPHAQVHVQKAMPDCLYVHRELARKHVTLNLLWTEYCSQVGQAAYGYTQFCEYYRRWSGKLSVVMRQAHKAGEKTFIDYSGDGVEVTDLKTGEVKKAELFVATLGASSYTYAELTWSQTLPDWVASHTRMVQFFGGTSEIWVPDNLKSGVTESDRYQPLLNETYRDCAIHYGAIVIPARAARPRDKAKVEVNVQVAQRWILARLRNRRFTSLNEANVAVAECLEILNARRMRHLDKTRQQLFEEIDKPALKPVPASVFEFAIWKKATLNIDYHLSFDHHHYSALYQFVKETLDVRATSTVVEIYRKGKRIASHRRSYRRGGYTTLKEHMPASHREHAEWTPERVISWAQQIGTHTSGLVEKILVSKAHPELGFRQALGLIRLKDKYGRERLERACLRALEIGVHSYRFVNEMLKNKMDLAPVQDHQPMAEKIDKQTNEVQLALLSAENIRGAGYYH